MTRRLALAAAVVALALPACRERGRPDPAIRMAISHEATQEQPAAGGGEQAAAPTRLEVPPEVAQVYSGIRLAWKDVKDGKSGVLEVPLGGQAPLPDPSLVVRADVFLPAFSMAGGVVTTQGTEPQNPAARITVLEGGREIFGGWIFTRFPDVHPFTHPRFQLLLEGGVPRAAK